MSKKLLLFTFLFLSAYSFAQIGNLNSKIQLNTNQILQPQNNSNTVRNCGTMGNLAKMIDRNPDIKNRVEQSRTRIAQYANANSDALSQQKTIYHIPVVVHVVYKNGIQNISDAQIHSQIDALNKDYQKLNTDIGQVPGAFAGLAADVGIEFCLAIVDPNGNPTNGITRTSTSSSTIFDENNNNVKFNANGGENAWNSLKYFNLWVCDLDGTLLGYAQFPSGGSLNTDGVVIDYADFGTNGTATAPFNLGRTTTHEIGHWLGLYHIWGDEPNCAGDDGIADTPQQKDKNFGCPVFPQGSIQAGGSCSGSTPGSMFMNYMDYTDDACMFMFTNDQKTVMLSALTNERASLLNSNGCGGVASCDSISNYLSNDIQQLYMPSDLGSSGTGFVAGLNSFYDKSKADKYTPSNNFMVKGLWIYFGIAGASSGSNTIDCNIWDDNGAGGKPNSILATKTITLQEVVDNLNAVPLQPSYIEFDSLIAVSGSFYYGITFDTLNVNTLGLLTNTANMSLDNNAWEQWSDNTWHQYNESGAWNVTLTHQIYAIMCPPPLGESELAKNGLSSVELFPNPSNDRLFINVGKNNERKDLKINIINLLGETILTHSFNASNSTTISVETNSIKDGIYLIEVLTDKGRTTKKFNVIH